MNLPFVIDMSTPDPINMQIIFCTIASVLISYFFKNEIERDLKL